MWEPGIKERSVNRLPRSEVVNRHGSAGLILASSSPRRQELLEQLGLTFEIAHPGGDEVVPQGWQPAVITEKLALDKAMAVAAKYPDAVVVGADTVVVLDGRILGKPAGPDEAVTMLGLLSGRTHTVITGVAVVGPPAGANLVEHEETLVTFYDLTPEEIRRYVATGEPLDKAGAYGIQRLGALLVAGIAGCYFNVVGLPVARLARMLHHFGMTIL